MLSDLNREIAPLMLSGAILLLLAGITMLAYSARMRHQQASRRIGLIEPRPPSHMPPQIAQAAPIRETLLLRGTAGSLPERDQREIIRRLAALHIPAQHASTAFLILRLVCVVLFAAGMYALGAQWQAFANKGAALLLAALALGIIGWFAPAPVVARMAQTRAKSAAEGLPDALELLVVCVEAGLALEDGIDRMVVELRHSNPDLADEFAQTSADLKILPTRDQALMKLAERIDVPAVRSVVTTLSQTMRYGTPLAQAMRVVAAEMRNDSLIELEERANRLPTLLTLPMMLFIMPTIFLIVGGPAALRIIDNFWR